MLSVLIPVYNEADILEKNINRLDKFLKSLGIRYEILVCNNGSIDNTNKIGNSISSIRFFSMSEKGVGRAFKLMFEKARYDKLVSVDIDLSTDIRFIKKACNLLDEYDIVIGSKIAGEQNRTLDRILISKTYIRLVQLLLGFSFSDYSIGAKAFRKSKIKLPSKISSGSMYVLEILMKNKTCSMKEIPVFCNDRRKSKFSLSREIFHRFTGLLKLWWKVRKI
ncbi:MAG: glycosyltransferase family 2 protein [Candidatus Aenigmarchaeota archaeon]|nr:glycosyltransferase family 2 protein [Candidatus Aenigmarchaeota archaeon]